MTSSQTPPSAQSEQNWRTYTIGTPGGQKLDIRAPDEASALRGAREWYAEHGAPSTSYVDAFKQGASSVVSGLGETIEQYGPDAASGIAKDIKSAAAPFTPKNYTSATILSEEKGFTPSNLPRAGVEAVPGLAAAIAAARATPGHPIMKLLGGAAGYAATTVGPRAKERAVARTGDMNAEPTADDRRAALIAMLPESLVGTFGLARFLPGAGKVAGVGLQGVLQSGKELAKTAGAEMVASGGQNAIAQVGRTAGTKGGINIDPYEMGNDVLAGGAAGGALGAPKAGGDVTTSYKFREFGGANTPASAAVANRLQKAADGNLRNPANAFEAVKEARRDVRGDLRDAVKEARAEGYVLEGEAKRAVERARAGAKLSTADFRALKGVEEGRENGGRLEDLARQASVLASLKDKGIYSPSKRTFTGGVSSRLDKVLPKVFSPMGGGIAAGAGALGAQSLIPGYAKLVGAAYGTYGAARLADRLTGARSPAYQFADRFSGTPKAAGASHSIKIPDGVRMDRSPSKGPAAKGTQEAPVSDRLRFTKVNAADRAIADMATRQFAESNPDTPPVVLDRYHASAAKRQARIRDRLQEVSGDPNFPAESVPLMEALDAIRDVRSREALAAHIGDLSVRFPDAVGVLHKYFGPAWARTVWNPSRR
ncbi:MAG: hypothetical protein MPJ78_11045 [Hyphomicrobiaceae bacterium]|nr:hypothetical protein [Hyphomicrobiaceae bacterium]